MKMDEPKVLVVGDPGLGSAARALEIASLAQKNHYNVEIVSNKELTKRMENDILKNNNFDNAILNLERGGIYGFKYET